MAVEQAKYTVEQQYEELEIRQYAPYMVAETLIAGRACSRLGPRCSPGAR